MLSGYRRAPWSLMLVVCLFVLGACSPRPEPLLLLPPDAVILAFGDSLTYGTGAPAGASYPSHLARMTGLEVINAGVPGEVTTQGRARLPGLLDQYQPDLLILIHGGNDMLRRGDSEHKRQNLEAMIFTARERDIQVVMAAVPTPALWRLSGAQVYQDLADELGVTLEGDALAYILSRDSLKADPIHPNAEGYRILAERVHDLLREAGALIN
ncbi:hydrolase GDSL [Ectothiorhodospira haloalkaliphila]|uniref:Hydrolase GDSL n=1 Tax=Ectothiorhodospira haloalkaliphila TaxID=421628 RepID=W8KUA7_9GAMM|nr:MULTISPECIES: arylesterase [Ectothiorhodospira]AHK79121.1 hydrolase GDSL [Ectothiorhodospira haloalkaliphila]MCG5494182.1 arylesterase [Ectothiorhodospira variabilis]MCG5497413.1 arylesterase [Ectothiorhodospira variabilis]MCG5503288.1 arylesterase [Ectothiorhodospira variabilis]MCG5506624.1 arylesterase [Ectothiorhodospira variabilis]